MALQGAVLKPAPNASGFTIYHRDETGKPCEVYGPEHSISTCVVESVNICRSMLKTDKVRLALIELAKKYSLDRPNAWFLKSVAKEEVEQHIADFTEAFLEKVLARFPDVFVDDSLRKPSTQALHFRREWDPSQRNFEMSIQHIGLNGPLLKHMLGAAIAARTSGDGDDLDNQDHRNFLFMFASSILHEIGHVFFTLLNEGKGWTPRNVKAQLMKAPDETRGESGASLEELVFGGVLGFWRDPICGTPYVIIETGTKTGWYRITQATINRTVNSDIKFPYDHTGIDESHLGLVSMGHGQPEDKLTDPLEHPDWPKLRDDPLSAAR